MMRLKGGDNDDDDDDGGGADERGVIGWFWYCLGFDSCRFSPLTTLQSFSRLLGHLKPGT